MNAEPTTVGARHRRPTILALCRAVWCVLAVTPVLRWLVIVHAVPADRPWRHSCPRCAAPLRPGSTVGTLSPRARCGGCRQRLGPPPWSVELAAVTVAVAVVGSGATGSRLAGYGWWAALGVVLSCVDLSEQRLPARLSHTATVGLLGWLGLDALLHGTWHAWVRALLGAIAAAAVLGACAVLMPRLLHWGDVRFAAATGAAAAHVGWLGLYAATMLSTLFAAAAGVGLLLARRATLTTHLPLGPCLFAGTLATVTLLGG